MATTLAHLAHLLATHKLLSPATNIQGCEEVAITGADCDSRHAAPGHLFVCKGVNFRDAYLASALERGAVAYLCGEEHASRLAQAAPNTPVLVSNDVRSAMSLVSPVAWERPDHQLTTVGITGTKGKTTTTYLLRSILDGASEKPQTAVMGSVETFDGIERFASINTTPESPDLWRHVANARDAGLPYLVTEVSSQALKYGRVEGLSLNIACFLNIGNDHISPVEHPTLEDYFQSKLRIFAQAKRAVVNLDSERLDEVLAAAQACENTMSFSATSHQADVWADGIVADRDGQRFFVHTPSWEAEVRLALPGRFNVENALCAVCVCELLGVSADQVIAGLAEARVPGRMELVSNADGSILGVVDFAHNQMAFAKFFPAVRAQFPGRRVVSVFGAVGGKAVERREELPREAARWSDYLIYTEDDPGNEPVASICAAMEQATPDEVPCETILDREQAVARAVELARTSGEPTVICLLCRGTEPTQHRGSAFVPVKLDTQIMREALGA